MQIVIHEGQKYFFGNINFVGPTIYGGEALRGQILDLLRLPYTEGRLADIPRRLQAYYKTRGYFAVKVDAVGEPNLAINGHVPVRVTVDPGQVYYFDGVTVKGTRKLRPSYLVNRLKKFRDQPYSPETLDKSSASSRGQVCLTSFGSIQRRSTATICASTSTSRKRSRRSLGSRLVTVPMRARSSALPMRIATLSATADRSRPRSNIRSAVTRGKSCMKILISLTPISLSRYELAALTFDYVGYSKFELGGRVTLSRQVTDKYSIGFVYSARHVEITDASIKQPLLGPTSYFVSAIGFTQTLDLRKNPLVAPRGFVFDNTLDFASSAIGSEIDLFRTTGRASYYLSFAPDEPQLAGEDLQKSSFQKWFEHSLLAFGGRAGVVYPLDTSGLNSAYALPIDERFFNGGSATVRSSPSATLVLTMGAAIRLEASSTPSLMSNTPSRFMGNC